MLVSIQPASLIVCEVKDERCLHIIADHAAQPHANLPAGQVGGERDVVADTTHRLADAGWIGCVQLRCRLVWLRGRAGIVAGEVDGDGASYEYMGIGVRGNGLLRRLWCYKKSICTT